MRNWKLVNVSLFFFLLSTLLLLGRPLLGQEYQVLHEWLPCRNPNSPLIRGGDGRLYGSSSSGGRDGCGALFRLTDEGEFEILVHFKDKTTLYAPGSLIRGKDGALYGIANAGGADGTGGVFRYDLNGEFSILKEFGPTALVFPTGRLAEDESGNLYGIAGIAKTDPQPRAVFRLAPDGTLSTFATFPQADMRPNAALLVGADGHLYGSTSRGGSANTGTLFRFTPQGSFQILVNLSTSTGLGPQRDLWAAQDGSIYGANSSGGVGNGGNIFRYSLNGGYSIVKQFGAVGSPYQPAGGVVRGDNGMLYGLLSRGGENDRGVVYRLDLTTAEYANITPFPGGQSAPTGLVTFSGADELLAVANDPISTNSTYSLGYVAKIRVGATPSLTILRPDNSEGAGDIPTLTSLPDGSYAGVTFGGGNAGLGTVFKVSPAGNHTVLLHFDGSNGSSPTFPLTRAKDGLLYGVTATGGTNGFGVLFRISESGSYEKLADFDGSNGKTPSSPIAQAPDGTLYGVTIAGGIGDFGVLYKWTSSSGLSTRSNATSSLPSQAVKLGGPLAISPDGTIFGTYTGGVFRLTADSFSIQPYVDTPQLNGVTLAADGFLYATGAVDVPGFDFDFSVYRITADSNFGAVNVLGRFPKIAGNGSAPKAPPFVATDGTVIGTTSLLLNSPNSSVGGGVVWAITPTGALRTVYSSGLMRRRLGMGSQPIQAANGDLVIAGNEIIFRIVPSAPVITTKVPMDVAGTSASLRGTVENAGGGDARVYFQREDLPAEENWIPTTPAEVGRYVPNTPVQAMLSGLSPHTTYRVRVVARNEFGFAAGEYVPLTTANAVPTAQNDSVHYRSEAGPIVGLLANDTDADGDALHIVSVRSGVHVMTSLNLDGGIVIAPDQDFTGNDTFTYTVSDGFGGTAEANVVLTNGIPIANFDDITVDGISGATFSASDLIGNDQDADGDPLTVLSVGSGTFGSVTKVEQGYRYTPSPTFNGTDLLTYTVADGHGGVATGEIRISITAPFCRPVVSAGEVVGIGATALTLKTFGIPSINVTGKVAFVATGKTSSGTRSAVLVGNPLQAVASSGAAADGGGVWLRFDDPVLSATGAVAFKANLGGVSKSKDVAVFGNASGTLVRLIGEGDEAPGIASAKIASIDSIAITDQGLLIALARLSTSFGAVTRSSDLVLFRQSAAGGFETLLREGQSVPLAGGLRTVKSFSALAPSTGSPDARRNFNSSGDLVTKITFQEGGDGVFIVRSGESLLTPILLSSSLDAASDVESIVGNPCIDDSGAVVLRGVVRIVSSGAKAARSEQILFRSADGQFELIAQTGGSGEGTSFASFQDPVLSKDGILTFVGSLVRKKGEVTSGNDVGIWQRSADGTLTPVVREGDVPGDYPNTKFAVFKSLVSVPERGAAFVGTLAGAPRFVTSSTDSGLWAKSTSGALRLLIKEGDKIPSSGGRIVRAIAVLSAVPGSLGDDHSFSDSGTFICRISFTDGVQEVVKVVVP